MQGSRSTSDALGGALTVGSPSLGPSGASLLEQYAAANAQAGRRIVKGQGDTFWATYESCAMMRIPTFATTPPHPLELRKVFHESWSAMASYLIDPDDTHPANAWLYLCQDKSYSLDKLGTAARRDARRAGRHLRIGFANWPAIMAAGFRAFSETRGRVGLSDGTIEQFHKRFQKFAENPFHQAVGAWKDDCLVAFMSLAIVDDWVEIEGSFSANEGRSLCPNDGLAHFVLGEFLGHPRYRTVSYGLSSIQDSSEEDGLHNYKRKVGFEARPVHRAFILHPWLRPLANTVARTGAHLVSKAWPQNRFLKKAKGVLLSIGGSLPAAPR